MNLDLEQIKKLAKQVWDDGHFEGNQHDYYYYEHGFIAGWNKLCHLQQDRLTALDKLSGLDQELGLE